jgi:type III pantothenate kinase
LSEEENVLLAIDIGNTNVSVGVFQGEGLAAAWRIATDAQRMPDEYGLTLRNLFVLRNLDPKEIDEGCMCSVVPPLTATMEQVCKRYFGVTPLVVGAGTRTGVQIRYDTPHDVGSDRIVDAVAAFRLYGGPVIVVDIGTATVFDAISREGNYLGGAIAPGLRLAAESLYLGTSQLRRVELVAPESAIGKNTVSAIQSGLVLGYVELVEGMVRRFKEELGGAAKVVATGGQAGLIARETRVFDYVNKDLTLIGLRMVYEMNRDTARGDT